MALLYEDSDLAETYTSCRVEGFPALLCEDSDLAQTETNCKVEFLLDLLYEDSGAAHEDASFAKYCMSLHEGVRARVWLVILFSDGCIFLNIFGLCAAPVLGSGNRFLI